jgi:hypothetical protein
MSDREDGVESRQAYESWSVPLVFVLCLLPVRRVGKQTVRNHAEADSSVMLLLSVRCACCQGGRRAVPPEFLSEFICRYRAECYSVHLNPFKSEPSRSPPSKRGGLVFPLWNSRDQIGCTVT